MADRTPSVPLSAVAHGRDGSVDPLNAVKYVAGDTPIDPTTPQERTARFEAVVKGVGAGPQGFGGVLAAMERGAQTNVPQPGLHGGGADRMHAAFTSAVNEGAWTEADTKALVAAEVRGGATPGQAGAVSSYLAALSGPNAEATRVAFARESIAAAQSVAAARPEASAHLYAQGAEALGGLSPGLLRSTLETMRASDPAAVSKLTYGAIGGAASLEQARREERALVDRLPIDGVGSMISKLAQTNAQPEMTDAVHGVSQYLTEKRGTPAEQILLANDGKTGLRDAMTSALSYEPGGKSNFDAVLRANRDASGLSTDGMNLMSNLSRLELGASATDAASHRFGETAGNVMGHLAVDLARSTTGQDAELQREFGRGAFGNGAPAAQETAAARTLGNLVGQMREGLNADFDVRSGAAVRAQEELTSTLGKISAAAKTAAVVPGPQAAVLKTFSETVDHLKEQVPRDRTLTSDQAHDLVEKLEGGVKELLQARPGLQAEFKNGLSDSASFGRDVDEHAKRAATNKAADREGGMIGREMRDLVAPQPKEPGAPRPATADELTAAVREAVKEHNAHRTGHQAILREPGGEADVHAWKDDRHRPGPVTGTLLEVKVGGKDLYVIHTGRGQYATLDPVTDLHGVKPELPGRGGEHSAVGEVVHLRTDGTVNPSPPHQTQQHGQPAAALSGR